MRGIRRLFCVVLCLLLLTACADTGAVMPPSTTPTTTPVPTEREETPVFTLAYSRSDSLDPYKMTTRVNRDLSGLLYEGLTAPDSTTHAKNVLASRVQVTAADVTAVLREDACFSDGSAVTVDDVLASFAMAQQCAAYQELLRGVESAQVAEDGCTLVFTLTTPDPYAAACLSFPVIRVEADGTVRGSGPFVFEDTPRLVANPHTSDGNVREVRLLDLVDDDSLVRGLELGNLTYFVSPLADGTIPRVNAATASVSMNSLVFLGVNSAKKALSNAEVRTALSLALDRTRVADSAFAGYAEATALPFPSAFLQAEGVTADVSAPDRPAAMTLLAAQGYATATTMATTGVPLQKTDPLELTLLVHADNGFKTAMAAQVREQLGAIGVTVTVQEMSFSDYQTALKRGRYDLYIGEIRLGANLDLSPLLEKNGAASFGVASQNGAVTSYRAFRAGQATLETFLSSFSAAVPFIPVCWRQGMAAYDRALTNISPTAYSVYAGLPQWQLGT